MTSKKKLASLVTNDFRINRTVLNQVYKELNLPKEQLEEIVLSVLKKYKEAYEDNLETMDKTEAKEEAFNGKKNLVNRISNDVLYEASSNVKAKFNGVKFRWLPSDAENPDPLHQLKYGKVFRLGEDEAPQDRYGCKCGMEILDGKKETTII